MYFRRRSYSPSAGWPLCVHSLQVPVLQNLLAQQAIGLSLLSQQSLNICHPSVPPWQLHSAISLRPSALQLIDQLDRLASVRLVTTFSPAAEGPDVTANRTAISSSAATAYTPIAIAEAYSRLPLLATIP